MIALSLQLNPGERLDVEHAVQLLKQLFPSTTVKGDTFERKWRQLEESFAALSDQGTPVDRDLLRRDLARREAETGPGVDVSIALGDATKIEGFVLTGGIKLLSQNQLTKEVVDQVEVFLRSFNIGRVVIG